MKEISVSQMAVCLRHACAQIVSHEPELTAIAAYANAAGSLATTRKGAIAIMPDRAQVEECMKNCPKKGEN